jgi:hypothetical protein
VVPPISLVEHASRDYVKMSQLGLASVEQEHEQTHFLLLTSAGLVLPASQGVPPPLLQSALGMLPSEAPVSPDLLQQATALDEMGEQLLTQVGKPPENFRTRELQVFPP